MLSLDPPDRAVGIKCVSLSEDLFADHFPGHPVFPGAMTLEGMATLGGLLLEATLRARGLDHRHALLIAADKARFRRMVRPGDRLVYEVTGRHATEDGGRVAASARLDGEDAEAAYAELTYAFTVVSNPAVIARRAQLLHLWLHGSTEPA